MEVEASKIRTLERITVAGLQSTGTTGKDEDITVNVVLYNNEYYCIDDPLLLEGKEKVKVRVVTEVNDLNTVYTEYIKNNTRNTLNPYMLLLLYKENKFKNLPAEIKNILERNQPIDNDLLRMLNTHLLKIEEEYRGKPIFISLTILDAISQILQYIERGLAKEEVIRIIDEYLRDYKDKSYVQYPTPLQLTALVEALVIEEEEEKKREEERRYIEELKKRKMQGSQSVVYQADITSDTLGEIKTKVTELLEEEEEEGRIPITVSGSGEVREDDNIERIRDEKEEKEEEGSKYTDLKTETMKNTLLVIKLTYPVRIEDEINRIINKFIKELEKSGVIVVR
ncbi:hypothetical protein HRbin04_01352 [archaeon HR04]|nr:hypothetical protein HRbin04_01352 [archaeon HR04]